MAYEKRMGDPIQYDASREIRTLQQERDEVSARMRELHQKEGEWTSDDDQAWRSMESEHDEIESKIKRAERLRDLSNDGKREVRRLSEFMTDEQIRQAGEHDREVPMKEEHGFRRYEARSHAAKLAQRVNSRTGGGDDAVHSLAYRSAFDSWARFGREGVTPEEARLLQEGQFRAQGTGNTAGGYTIPTDVVPQIVDSIVEFNELAATAGEPGGISLLVTDGGNPLQFPGNNTKLKGRVLAENNAMLENRDEVFNVKTLNAWTYVSDVILVPVQLMDDSAVDIEAYIAGITGERVGRITAEHHATGTGTNQIEGLTIGAAAGPTADAIAITYDEAVLDLKHSVNRGYQRNGRFVFADSTLLLFKKLKDADDRPLWQPQVFALGNPPTIDGSQYVVNDDMPAVAANARPVVFGSLRYYQARQVRQVGLTRFGEKYMNALQVGFMSYVRMDAKVIDGSGGALKYLLMPGS